MTSQPWQPQEDHYYYFCQQVYPDATYVHIAESRVGRINWDSDVSFEWVNENIIYCDAEIDGYRRQSGHFAVGPDEAVYELRREGRSFYPIYYAYNE